MVLMRSSRYKKHKQMEVLPDMKKALRLFDRFLYWVETLTSTGALIVITALVFGQVILRYLFSKSMPWAEEVIITLIIAMAMFGAARGVRSHAHVDVVGVANILPWWSAYILRAITTLIAIVLLVLTSDHGVSPRLRPRIIPQNRGGLLQAQLLRPHVKPKTARNYNEY